MSQQDPEARNVAWSALRQAIAAIGVADPLVDNTPLGGGAYWVRKGVFIGAGQTLVPIQLPRTPSGVVIVDNDTGAVVFRTAADRAASGPSTYACRATGAGASIVGIFL